MTMKQAKSDKPKINLSCLPVSLYQDISAGHRSLADWFRFAKALGLEGADVSVAHIQSHAPAYLAALSQDAAMAGVQIMMLVTYSDFTHPDPHERARQIEALKRHIDIAAHLGATALRVTAGQAHLGVGRDEGIAWAVAGLTACLDQAAQAGLTLAYENHTIGYGWTYQDFSRPANIFLEIVARTESTTLGLLYDTANTIAHGDDPLAVLAQVNHRVRVVHVSDVHQVGQFEPVVIGTGVAPIRPIFEQLQAIGFEGWVSIEEASRTGEAGFEAAIDYTKRAWREAAINH